MEVDFKGSTIIISGWLIQILTMLGDVLLLGALVGIFTFSLLESSVLLGVISLFLAIYTFFRWKHEGGIESWKVKRNDDFMEYWKEINGYYQ